MHRELTALGAVLRRPYSMSAVQCERALKRPRVFVDIERTVVTWGSKICQSSRILNSSTL